MAALTTPNVDYKKEIRFAVVMYGGVSLAIYINGIAQEFLSLVRSTAEAYEGSAGRRALSGGPIQADDDENTKAQKLRGTERIYRKLSHLLSDHELLKRYKTWLKEHNARPGTAKPDLLDDYLVNGKGDQPEPITTGFIVDILSGTSAGGINAIFLAKALANDQAIDKLKQLWIQEGDIGVLINDKKSMAGLNLDNQDPPKSLLNSRRMYLQLLKAFDGMDRTRESQPGQVSPYVNELDLFVTTTDIKGDVLPLQLSDKIVYEKRHRNVFHFKYGTHQEFGQDCNHFLRKYNPFLAFAARCTSSFPFAFEPMRLWELDGLLKAFGDKDHNYAATSGATSELWKPFFKERSDVGFDDNQQARAGTSFLDRVGQRAFGDGGYLDNKPFSYATETLARRQSNVPVERKLVYIEPSPEHSEDERQDNTPPNVFANAKAALLDLPTYETIREDLQRVLRRNRTFQRINKIVEATNEDLENNGRGQRRYKFHSGHWRLLDMAMMVKYCGIYFLPYRRLRIASVTDDLASLVARIKGVDERSDSLVAVRGLLRAWRIDHYVENYNAENSKLVNSVLDDRKPVEKPKPPEHIARKLNLPPEFPDSFQLLSEETYNAFLDDFDFAYRFRRLTFVLGKIDELMRIARESSNPQTFPSANPVNPEDAISLINHAGVENAIALLNYLKCELLEVHKTLRTTARKLQSAAGAARRSKNSETRPLNRLVDANLDKEIAEFYNEFSELKLDARQLKFILGIPGDVSDEGNIDLKGGHGQEFAQLNEKVCEERAVKLYQSDATLNRLLKNIASKLKKILSGRIIVPTSSHCKQLLNSKGELPEPLSESCTRIDVAGVPQDAMKAVRDYLYEYYIHFDDYDQVRFPILYQTEFGESAEVDIFRISPEDAPNLINERGPGSDGRKKLAGNALFHFGAFLDRVWRENDIMWGRLDGAERLITALMPNPDHQLVRDKLISDAHLAILQEEMPPQTQLQLSGLLSEALIRASSGEPFEDALVKVVGPLQSPKIKQRLATAMRACLEDEKLLNFVKEHYEVNRELEPKPLLRSMARATQVTGRIFDDVAQAHQVDSKSIRWIARAGQIFWGLVEVAVPQSIPHLLFRQWLKLLYTFEVFIIVGATLLSKPQVVQFGWTAFGITLGANVVVWWLRDVMSGRSSVRRFAVTVLLIAFLGLALIGALKVAHLVFGLGIDGQSVLAWLHGHFNNFAGWFSSRLPGTVWSGIKIAILPLMAVAFVVILWRRGRPILRK